MLTVTEEFIGTIAPNQNTVSSGKGLVKQNKFVKLCLAEDQSLLMGECRGSGADNYLVSVDFIKPDTPTFRCSCPSRQIPCKHVIGLLYAHQSGKTFETIAIPQDIADKREKAEKKQEKQAEKRGQKDLTQQKVNKSALKKKIAAQLEGLEILEKIAVNITQSGLGTINSKTLKILEDQAKQLDNYYLKYPQSLLREFLVLFQNSADHEQVYSRAIDILVMLHALCKKGQNHLMKRLADPTLSLDASSALDELLGHTWQLAELNNCGLMRTGAELMQLPALAWPEVNTLMLGCGLI